MRAALILMLMGLLGGCAMSSDKNVSLCGQLGLCNEEEESQDAAWCGYYGNCSTTDDGDDDEQQGGVTAGSGWTTRGSSRRAGDSVGHGVGGPE